MPEETVGGNPMTPHEVATTQQPQQGRGLDHYAAGIANVNIELQRQTDAYAHFRDVLAKLDALAQDPNGPKPTQLPFVIVRFPTSGSAPGEMKLDLNTMDIQTLLEFQGLFRTLAEAAGAALLTAWENIHRLADATKPTVANARQALGQ